MRDDTAVAGSVGVAQRVGGLLSLQAWVCALSLCLLPLTTHAQDDAFAEEVEEVIVTGSYIRGTPEDAPNPVTVLSREDLFEQGSPTIVEIIKNLGISSGVDGETNQFQSNALEGAANVNLRGLGPGRTLTLFNGKRMPYSGVSVTQAGYQQFVNINQIPAVALARVELLRDGASAIYGTDAVSGVVNFITRSDFEGLEISANHRAVDGSDGWNELGVAFGHTFDNGNHLLIAGGYNTRDELPIAERDYALRPFAENPLGGWSGLGNPGRYLGVGAGTTFRDPDCGNFSSITRGTDDDCRFQFTQYDNLIEEEERWQIYGEYEINFSDTNRLTFSVLAANTHIPEWKTSPSYPPASTFLANIIPKTHPGFVQLVNDVNAGRYSNLCSVAPQGAASAVRVWRDNPGDCAGAGRRQVDPNPDNEDKTERVDAREGGFYTVDGEVVGVTYGQDSGTPTVGDPLQLFIGRVLGWGASGPAVGEREYDKIWVSADFEAVLANGVDMFAAVSFGRQKVSQQGYDLLANRLSWALRGFGGPQCSPLQDPATRTDLISGVGGCLYYNPFSNGLLRADRGRGAYVNADNPNYDPSLANAPELLDWMQQPTYSDFVTELLDASLVFAGTFAGHGWAAGASVRDDRLTTSYYGFNNALDFPCQNEFVRDASLCPNDSGVLAFLSPGVPVDVDETAGAVFGEIQWLLGDTLRIQTAVRYEQYEDSGNSLDPKISVRFEPTDWLSLRASIGSSYKAPQLSQISLQNNTSLSFIGAIRTFKAVDTSVVVGGLDPESAQTGNFGLIVQKGGWFATLDYWTLTLKDPILTESFAEIISAVCPRNVCDPDSPLANRLVLNGADLSASTEASVALTAGSLNRVRVFVINAESLETSGVDLTAKYTFALQTPVTIGVEWSRTLEYLLETRNLLTGEIGSRDHVGQLNQQYGPVRSLPEDKIRLTAAVDVPTAIGDFNFNFNYDYVAEYKDDRSGTVDIDEQGTLDFNVSYTPNDGATRLFFNVDNLTDESPPLASLEISYDPYTHSPLGRTYKFGIVHQFR